MLTKLSFDSRKVSSDMHISLFLESWLHTIEYFCRQVSKCPVNSEYASVASFLCAESTTGVPSSPLVPYDRGPSTLVPRTGESIQRVEVEFGGGRKGSLVLLRRQFNMR